MSDSTSVSDATRHALETIGDYLIPEAHGMPSAGSMGVGTTQLDAVLASRQLHRAYGVPDQGDGV